MKPGIIITIVTALLAAAGLIGYVSTRDSNQNANSNTVDDRIETDGTIVKPDGTMIDPDEKVISENKNTNSSTTKATSQATYTDYSPSALAAAEVKGRTVLYFHANWCPTCKALDPDIQSKIGSLPAGLTILKVNYDTETTLKKKYGVTYQHTFVQVDAQGNKLKLWSGSTNANDIAAQIL